VFFPGSPTHVIIHFAYVKSVRVLFIVQNIPYLLQEVIG
jgi:hypothetical protein